MKFLDFLGIKKMTTASKAVEIIQMYCNFYEENKNLPISFYGLIPFGEKGSSRMHERPYTETTSIDFPFEEACIWEDWEDEEKIEKVIDIVEYGNITIAKEGCETYWLLITAGKHRGEVWLLTEMGLTPATARIPSCGRCK